MSADTNEERRSRRGLGIIAAVAAGLLLLGGTTYALWSGTASQAGGTITNGNLDVTAVGATSYWDVSTDRTDETVKTPITVKDAHAIASIAGYTIVPGDALEANYGFAVALQGDNLVGDLKVTLPSGATPPAGVTFTAQAYYLAGAVWTAVGTPVALTPGGTAVDLGYFQAANELNGTVDGALPIVTLTNAAGASSPNVAVIVTANFAAATTNRTSTLASTALGDVTVSLTQVRTAGVGNFK